MTGPVFVWLLLSLIWGTTWLGIKIGLEGFPPFTFAAMRFFVAAIPLFVLLKLRRKKLSVKRSEWRLIAVTGLFTITVNYGLVFWGENYIPSGLTAIFYSVFPLFGLAFAHFHLPGERMTIKKIAAVLLGILGVTLIFSNQLRLDNFDAVKGSAAIVVAALATAYSGVIIKSKGSHLDPLVLTLGQMVVGFFPLLFLGLLLEGNPLQLQWGVKSIVALLYLAIVGSALAFVLVYWLMQRMDVTKTQLIPLGSTLVAVSLGWIFLEETLSSRTLAGGCSILSGLALAIRAYRR